MNDEREPAATPSVVDLEGKFEVTSSGCHVWLGTRMKSGYGVIRKNGRQFYVHRVAFMLANGPLSDGVVVCHRCDVPACINKDHLFAGTHADNHADMMAKNRHAIGMMLPHTRLTPSHVRDIKRRVAEGESQSSIAAAFGCTQPHVSRIAAGKSRANSREELQ